MKIILLGAPGAGKGTQAEAISKKLSLVQISTGNIIRAEIASGSERGKQLKEIIDVGKLVSDEVVIEMLKQRIAQPDCANGYILDGVPRTLSQAKELDNIDIKIDNVVYLEVEESEIISRLSGRRVCEKCGSTYHIEFKPSKKGDICEKCEGKLIVRKDDEVETIKERLKVFAEKTQPLIDYYKQKGILKVVKGQSDVNDTINSTFSVLGL